MSDGDTTSKAPAPPAGVSPAAAAAAADCCWAEALLLLLPSPAELSKEAAPTRQT
jgi:hypothetical protein